MKIKYKVVNSVPEQYVIESALERKFINDINNYNSLKGIRELKLPPRGYFPEFEESKKSLIYITSINTLLTTIMKCIVMKPILLNMIKVNMNIHL